MRQLRHPAVYCAAKGYFALRTVFFAVFFGAAVFAAVFFVTVFFLGAIPYAMRDSLRNSATAHLTPIDEWNDAHLRSRSKRSRS